MGFVDNFKFEIDQRGEKAKFGTFNQTIVEL